MSQPSLHNDNCTTMRPGEIVFVLLLLSLSCYIWNWCNTMLLKLLYVVDTYSCYSCLICAFACSFFDSSVTTIMVVFVYLFGFLCILHNSLKSKTIHNVTMLSRLIFVYYWYLIDIFSNNNDNIIAIIIIVMWLIPMCLYINSDDNNNNVFQCF